MDRTFAVAPQLTRNQTLVLGELTRTDGPLSAYSLLDRLREHGLRAPLQIYRALEKLIEYGLVHRLESVNSFVACAHPHEHGQTVMAFAICDRCGQVDEFSDPAVDRRLKGWAKDQAFKLAATTIELHGTCANCQAA